MALYLVIGGSRGIGGAAAQHFVQQGHNVLSVSRTPSIAGEWIEADISADAGIQTVVDAVTRRCERNGLDALLFLGGVWEDGAFTDAYDFHKSPPEETRFVFSVNLVAPVLLAQALARQLARSPNPRIVLNGALSGVANWGSPEVANTASKFGLQGVAETLNIALRPQGIGVSVVNLGNVATPEVMEDIAEGRFGDQVPIPMSDVLATYDYLLQTSADTVPQSIQLQQKQPFIRVA